MSSLVRAIERASDSVGIAGAMLLIPLVVATCYEVVSRYVLGSPTIWAYEIGFMLTGAHFLLGMALTLRAGEHIRIDVFSGKFSAKTRAVIDLIGYAVVLPLTIWLSIYLFRYFFGAFNSGERTGASAFNAQVWPFRLIFFIAFVLLALQVFAEVLKLIRILRGPTLEAR
jgi:TRAP-type mannitol/chloroaromatic compound transport system permease small subunit